MSEAPRPAEVPADAPDFESTGEETIPPEVLQKRICDFDLRIEGRPLERVVERFKKELAARGFTRLAPVFYLTDEWGVPEGTVAIGIPFYLADARLLRVQRSKAGVVEGESEGDILRYLRHEMGHVVNYAYRLYATPAWTQLFGPMSRPYVETYKVVPFSHDFVRHLPGGYAQKHPDEDWAETFAVWMTPNDDWRARYADSPGALAKLEYCERTMKELADKLPEVVDNQIDYEAKDISLTVQEFYGGVDIGSERLPQSLDGDLRMLFDHANDLEPLPQRLGDAAGLLRRRRDEIANAVYRWTGVDPSVVQPLIDHLATRAKELKLAYPLNGRDAVLVEITGFVTTLAMNWQYRGKFVGS